jgi:hypothetical protein
MKSSIYRVIGAFFVAVLLVLGLRVETNAVPGGGDAMAVAAAQNADAMTEFLARRFFGVGRS